MPAESRRLRRRARSRDRWFLAAAACAAVVGTPVAVVLTSSSSGAGDRAGCVSRIEAGFMGGQTRTVCGTRAAALCRRAAARDAGLAAECRRAGLTLP